MRDWRWLMITAAAYNLVIGGVTLLNPAATAEGRVVGLLVACFGIVYALVARDLARFRPMLWAGVVGKAGVIALLAPLVMTGAIPPGTGPILVGDALFAVAFLILLLRPLPGRADA